MGNGYGVYSHAKKQWLWGFVPALQKGQPPKEWQWKNLRIDIWPGREAAERIVGYLPADLQAVPVQEGQQEIPPYQKPESP